MSIHLEANAGVMDVMPLDELPSPAQVPLPTNFTEFDRYTGGLAPGTLVSLTGPRGIGVSAVALDLAVRAAADRARVLVACGHLPGHILSRRVAITAARDARANASALNDAVGSLPVDRLFLVQRCPLPERDARGCVAWVSLAASCRLVVLDTLDEMDAPFAARQDVDKERGERVQQLRDLRDVARQEGLVVVVTTRLAPTAFDVHGVRAAWRDHPWHEAVMDAADLHMAMADEPDGTLRVAVENRLGADFQFAVARPGRSPLRREA